MSEATDENDLDLAIAVCREGLHIDKEEEDRSDRGVHTVGQGQRDRMAAGNAIPETDGSNLEIYSVTNRKPVEISKIRRNVTKTRFLGNDPSKLCSGQAESELNSKQMCQQRENYSSRVSNPLFGSYCLASLNGEGRSNVTECTNVKVR